jgi:hypothetical protein
MGHLNQTLDSCSHSAVSERTSDRGTSTEGGTRNPLEYDEDDQPPEQLLHRKEADVSIPNIPVPRSTSGEASLIRALCPKAHYVLTSENHLDLGHTHAQLRQCRP